MSKKILFPEIGILAKQACERYSGGITAVALLMEEMSPNLLSNKLNTDWLNKRNYLSLDELCQIVSITQYKPLVSAFAYLLGKRLVSIECDEGTDKEVLAQYIDVMGSCSEVGRELTEVTKDGSDLGSAISPKERRRIVPMIEDLISKSSKLLSRIKDEEQ